MSNPFGGNFQDLLRQAQRMQQDVQKLQEAHGEATFVGEAAGGLVKATVTGRNEVERIDVDRGALDAEDLDLVLDLVAAAVNDALRKAREALEAKTRELTGGLGLPGLM